MRSIKRKRLQKARSDQARKLISPTLGKPLLFFLLVGAASIIFRLGFREFQKRVDPLEVAAWKRYSPGRSGLSLLLPGEPQLATFKALAADPAVWRSDCYQVSIKEFQVELLNVSYHGEMPVDLRKAAEGVAATLKELQKATDYQETVTPTRSSGRSGMLVSGTFKRNGEPRQFRALLLGEGNRLWQVVVAYPPSYRHAQHASQRIIDSVNLN